MICNNRYIKWSQKKLFQSLLISSDSGIQSTNLQRILGNETMNVFLVACKDETSQTLVNILKKCLLYFDSILWIIDAKGEEDWRQVEQVRTLVKTIYLFTSVKVIIFIITNDQNFYAEILESFKSWEVDIRDKLRYNGRNLISSCIKVDINFHSPR